MNVREIIESVEKMRDSQEVEQLSTYVGRVSSSELTDEERAELGIETDDESIGYEQAGQLPVERLRELFEADDWGDAWEGLDREQTEYFEADEGRIEAYNAVLALLRGDPPLADSVCVCGHWYGEHDSYRCEAAHCKCKGFRQDLEASTPEAIADRGGDPEGWPEHVKAHFALQERRAEMGNNYGTLSTDYDAGYDDALGEVTEFMSGREWSPDTLEELSAFLTGKGLKIEEPGEPEPFDPLNALSYARTALDDPAGLPEEEIEDTDSLSERMGYAIDKVDEVMASLYFETGAQENDGAQAARVLTTLGRLLAALREEVERADGSTDDACVMMAEAGDRIDEAIGMLA